MTTPADAIAKLQTMDPNEPVFVLRAQDCLAPELVDKWIIRASVIGVNISKLNKAANDRDDMLQWHTRKIPD